MLKRTLCILISLCIAIQALPLTIFAEILDDSSQKEVASAVTPETFVIQGLNMQEGSVTVLSPDDRTALVVVAQYKNGKTVRVNNVEAQLSIGKNTITVPNYVTDNTATVKVMLLDSIDSLRPLCDSFEIGAKVFDVKFDTGSSNLTISNRTYPSNARFGKLPTPVLDDYLFIGWYYDDEFTKPVLEDDLVVDNCTLYAKKLNLAAMYGDNDTVLAERYVANADASADTKVLILSDDESMSADDVLKGITAENLSVFETTDSYKVERHTKDETDIETSSCEELQKSWLNSTDESAVFFVFYVKDGFSEGNSYRITLNDERLSFAGHEATAREYNLAVSRTTMSNLSLRDDIIFVNESLVNDVDNGEPEAQLFGISMSGTSGKSTNRFSIGNGASEGKLIVSVNGSKREIVESAGNNGNNLVHNQIGAAPSQPGTSEGTDIPEDEEFAPEMLNNRIIAVYSRNDNGETASLFGEEELSLPKRLTLEDSEFWNMDYRTIEGQIDGDYIYTETKSKDILFKPDVFPFLETEGTENGIVIKKAAIKPESKITNPVTNEEAYYKDFGITADTTVDVGDFIVFLKEENNQLVRRYVRITEVVEEVDEKQEEVYKVTYEGAAEGDIRTSMDMYGERELSAKELTGLDPGEYTEIEEQAEFQAINSGFANNAALYVSSIMVASEAFSDLSKEYELNYEEISRDLINAVDSAEVTLFDETKGVLYQRNGLTVYKPDVTATVNSDLTVNGALTAGIKLELIVSGDIEIVFGENPTSTITISYKIKFWQTLSATVSMTAQASVHYVLWVIPVIDDCTISTNIDFYTSSDVMLDITTGLQSEGVTGSEDDPTNEKNDDNEDKIKCVYVTPYGECYHRYHCFYLNEAKEANRLTTCTLSVVMEKKDKYRPCSYCKPGKEDALNDLLDKINGIRENVTNAVQNVEDFTDQIKSFQESIREELGVEPQTADDAGAAEVNQDTMSAALLAEKELIAKYQALLSNAYSDWAELYRVNLFSATVFSFYGIINVSVAMDFCLYANLNLVMEAGVHYENGKRYIFTIKPFKGEVKQSVQDLNSEQLTLDFLAMGTAGLKFGVELAIGVNFISDRICRVAVTGEVGFYLKMWGYFKYHYKSGPSPESSCHGALYIEAGPYLDVGFSASVFGKYDWNPSLYYQEFPLVTMGEKNAVIGFTDSANDTLLQLHKDNQSFELPKELLSMAYLDLRTGKTGKTECSEELNSAKQVRADPLTYVSEHYTLVIINDGNDTAFDFDPDSASIKVTPGNESKEESAELIIIYNLPAFAFNRTGISKKVNLSWDKFDGKEYTVILNSNGGNYLSPIIKVSGEEIELPTPKRPGYGFEGWLDDKGTLHKLDSTMQMPEEDMKLTAKWEPGKTTYTVNHWQYDLKGIPQLCETESFEATTEDMVTPEPKQYKGFVTPTAITVQAEGDGSTQVDYYYQRKTYLYELNVQNQTARRLVRYGDPIVLTDRDVPGYEFQGWFDNEGNSIFNLLGIAPISGVLAFNYEFDYPLTLNAKVAAVDSPYQVEFYTYQKTDSTTNTELIGTLQCKGLTDTVVDLTLDPKALQLMRLYKMNAGTEDFKLEPDKFNLEEWDYNEKIYPRHAKGKIKGDGSLVLRVYYEKAKRSITYQANSFSAFFKDVEVNKPIPLPDTNPTKQGNTFGGWEYYLEDGKLAYTANYDAKNDSWSFKDNSGTELDDDFELLMPRNPYSTKPIWIPNRDEDIETLKYTVNFDFNAEKATNGLNCTDAQTEWTFNEYGTLPTPTLTGWTFDGWYKDPELSERVGGGGDQAINLTESNEVTLYAKWNPNTYTVKYDIQKPLNATSKVNNFTDDNTVWTYDICYALPNPTLTGWTFDGWYSDEVLVGKGGDQVINLTESNEVTLYAKWTANIYYVKFDPNYAEEGEEKPSKTMDYIYDTTPEAYTLNRPGWIFVGWQKEGASEAEINGSGESLKNLTDVKKGTITLKAQWKPREYTATWENPENASIVVSRQSSPNAKAPSGDLKSEAIVYYGDVLSVEYSAEDGYAFSEHGKTSIEVDEYFSSKEQIYAKVTGASYTVEFDLNGSSIKTTPSCSLTSKTVKYKALYGDLPTPTATYFYTFDGWYTEKSGGTKIESSSTVDKASNHTLYAHWEKTFPQYTYLNNGNFKDELDLDGENLLVSNIDLSKYGTLSSSLFGTLTGKLDGQGFTISGLSIDIPATSKSGNNFYGLFSENKGSIQNLNISDSKIYMGSNHNGDGWVYAGIVCGINSKTIYSVHITSSNVTVHRDKSEIGCISGTNNGVIQSSTVKSECTVYGNGDLGGITGGLTGTIDNCTVDGITVKNYVCNNARASGGAVGYSNKGTIKNTNVLNTKMILTASSKSVDDFLGTKGSPQGFVVGHQKGGTIYHIGGGKDNGCTNTLENYDLKNWLGITYADYYFNNNFKNDWGWAGRISDSPSIT